jgi:hypothetical protein
MAPIGSRPAPRILVPITIMLIPALGDIKTFGKAKPAGQRAYDWLRSTIGEFFDEPFEHVAVLYDGERRDMFVGETSAINGRHIRNVRATDIYRANALAQIKRGNGFDPPPDPFGERSLVQFNPETLPAISGPAVLFPDFIVWK